MKHEKIEFPNLQGEMLAARLEQPEDRKPVSFAIFAHCFTCTQNVKAATNISRSLVKKGFAVLRFDFTGLGHSDGDFANTNFSSNVDDLLTAAEFLSKQYQPPKVLVGHSLGGAAVIQAAAKIDSVNAVATVAAPAEPGHIKHLLASSREEIEREGKAVVNIGGRPFTITRQFLEDLEKNLLIDVIQNLRKPILILHSPIDTVVGIENAASIFQAAKHPKSFLSLDRADHLLAEEADSKYAGAMIGEWAYKYV